MRTKSARQLDSAALSAHHRGIRSADSWTEHGAGARTAEPWNAGRYRPLVPRLLALVVSGDTDGQQPVDDALPRLADETTKPVRHVSGRFVASSVQSRNGCTYTRRTPFLPFCTLYRPKWPTCRIALKTSYFPHFRGGVRNRLDCFVESPHGQPERGNPHDQQGEHLRP